MFRLLTRAARISEFNQQLPGDCDRIRSGHIHDWHRPPPGFIFPDYLLFLPAYVFGKNIFIQIAIFIAIQALTMFAAVYLLIKQILDKDALFSSVLVISLLAWCALNTGEPFVLLLASVHHYGIFISSVLFGAIVLKYLDCKSEQRQRYVIVLCLFSIVCLLSDLLFLIQALIPLFFWVALANYWGFEKGRYSNYVTAIAPWVLGILCLTACIVYYLSYPQPLLDFYGKMKILATNAPLLFYTISHVSIILLNSLIWFMGLHSIGMPNTFRHLANKKLYLHNIREIFRSRNISLQTHFLSQPMTLQLFRTMLDQTILYLKTN